MSHHKRNIGILLILLVIMTLAVRYFFQRMEEERRFAQVNPYSLILPSPEAVLSINSPLVFGKMILPMSAIGNTFKELIPKALLPYLQEKSSYTSLLIASYTKSDILYIISMDKDEANQLFKHLEKTFSYAPVEREDASITAYYYPEADNRFLGCYYHNGLFVASYSHKLLAEAAERQQSPTPSIIPELKDLLNKAKGNTIHLFLPSKKLDIHIPMNDTTTWSIKEPWLSVELFVSEGNLYAHNEQTYEASIDSLYPIIRDSIHSRLSQLLPDIQLTSQVSHDENQVYYTICGHGEDTIKQ